MSPALTKIISTCRFSSALVIQPLLSRLPLPTYHAGFFLSLSLVQAIPDGTSPLQDAYQQGNFFLVWQPIYASITVAICLQDTVGRGCGRGLAMNG
jgi:hypothetical protein